MGLVSVGTPALWIGFGLFVLVMLAVDLGVFNRRSRVIEVGEALRWTGIWFALAMVFSVGIYLRFGAERALEFVAGYFIEKALSVDNLFVFLVVFSYFSVPPVLQRRVLVWGILGALVMRAFFIFAGAALLQRFHGVMYLFGAFLVFTGIKLLVQEESEVHPEKNPVLRLVRRVVPSVEDYRGERFFVRESGKWLATPLLMVLVVVEATDIVFAVDSIPAIFAVTADPFIVFTSNIFAILGLRALYFALAAMMGRFHYLSVGLGLVLAFVGTKMLIMDFYKIPIGVSLAVVVLLLVGAVVFSMLRPQEPPPVPVHPPHEPGDEPPSA